MIRTHGDEAACCRQPGQALAGHVYHPLSDPRENRHYLIPSPGLEVTVQPFVLLSQTRFYSWHFPSWPSWSAIGMRRTLGVWKRSEEDNKGGKDGKDGKEEDLPVHGM
jgi:hypothetical protein